MKDAFTSIYNKIGLPRLIIGIFLALFFIAAIVVGLPIQMVSGSLLVRFGMNAVLVLALIPAIKAGTGLNFALQLAIMCWLIGAVIAI